MFAFESGEAHAHSLASEEDDSQLSATVAHLSERKRCACTNVAHVANLNSARACAQSPCRCARQAHKFEHTAQWNQHELGHRTYAQRLFSGCTPEKNTNTTKFGIAMSFSESVSNNINVYSTLKPYRAVTVKNMCIRYSRFEVHTQMAMHVYPP